MSGKQSKEVGKRAERRAAKALGGKRSNIHGVAAPDIITPQGEYEIKFRTDIPDWVEKILDWLEASKGAATDRWSVIYIRGRKGLVFETLAQHRGHHVENRLPSPDSISWEEEE